MIWKFIDQDIGVNGYNIRRMMCVSCTAYCVISIQGKKDPSGCILPELQKTKPLTPEGQKEKE